MILPRDDRRAYLDRIASKCCAHTVDNASIDRRQDPWQGENAISNSIPFHTSAIRTPSPRASRLGPARQSQPHRDRANEEAEAKDEVASLIRIMQPDRPHIVRKERQWQRPKVAPPLLGDIRPPKGYVGPYLERFEGRERTATSAKGHTRKRLQNPQYLAQPAQRMGRRRDSWKPRTVWGRIRATFRGYFFPKG